MMMMSLINKKDQRNNPKTSESLFIHFGLKLTKIRPKEETKKGDFKQKNDTISSNLISVFADDDDDEREQKPQKKKSPTK